MVVYPYCKLLPSHCIAERSPWLDKRPKHLIRVTGHTPQLGFSTQNLSPHSVVPKF